MQIITTSALHVATEAYLDDAATKLSDDSVSIRARILRRLAEWHANEERVEPNSISDWLTAYPGATATRNDAYKRTKTFWNWAASEGYLPNCFHLVRRPRPVAHRRRTMLEVIDEMEARYPGSPLAPIACTWLRHRATSGMVKFKTVEQNIWGLDKLLASVPYSIPMQDDLAQAIWMPVSTRPLKMASKNGIYRAVKTFWRAMVDADKLPSINWKMIREPKSDAIPRSMTEEEIDMVFAGLEEGSQEFIMCAVLLDTGIRRGELANLKRSDLNDDTISVYGKTGWRTISIDPAILNGLRDLADGRGWIWRSSDGQRVLDAQGIQRRVRQALVSSGLTGRKLGPHLFRHTFGVQWVRGGGHLRDLQIIMGHANISTTMIYSHIAAEEVAERHRRFSPLVSHRRRVEGRDKLNAVSELWLPGQGAPAPGPSALISR